MLTKIVPFIVNIFLTIAILIGLAMGSKTLTGETWQAWLGNKELTSQTQQHIDDLENKLSALEKNQAKLSTIELQPFLKADTLIKKQKILWIVHKLQYKFSTGEPYKEEWNTLLSLVDPSLAQNPSLQTLSKFKDSGVMTKDKLRNLLLEKPEAPVSSPTQPSNFWHYFKSLVKIERAAPGAVQDQALLALEQGQLETYISTHSSYDWLRAPSQDLQNTQTAIINFYKALDSAFLTMEQS